jgi:hypothetical protein
VQPTVHVVVRLEIQGMKMGFRLATGYTLIAWLQVPGVVFRGQPLEDCHYSLHSCKVDPNVVSL